MLRPGPQIPLRRSCPCWEPYFDTCVTGMNWVTVQFCPNARPGDLPLHASNALSEALLQILGFWKMKCLYNTFWIWGSPDVLLLDDPWVTVPLAHSINNGKMADIASQWVTELFVTLSGLAMGGDWVLALIPPAPCRRYVELWLPLMETLPFCSLPTAPLCDSALPPPSFQGML